MDLQEEDQIRWSVETYKIELVIKDFKQKQEIDYNKTFSLVTMLKSTRILLAIATYYDYEIQLMNLKIAFLNDFLKKKVYSLNQKDLALVREKIKYTNLKKLFID